ncbi:MAG: hypothetical protein PHV16_00540 [Candidatus Nanoarchaeia archaeon]|nr:hypothetical protein [Candidatus Nanoarchaeia archaeon]
MGIEKNKWKENFRGISKNNIKSKKRFVKKDKKSDKEYDFKSIEQVIETLDKLDDKSYIFIQENINLFPKDKYGEEVSSNWFWKKANTANVKNFTAKESKENNIILPFQEISSLEKISLSKYSSLYKRGISWTGISDNSKRIIPTIYLIHGFRLYDLMRQSQAKVKIRDYGKEALVEGILSRSDPEKKRDITFRSLPITKENNEYLVEAFNLQSHSTSPGWSYRTIDEKYKAKEIVFGPEEIAAYIFRAMAKKTTKIQRNKTGKKQITEDAPEILINPFLPPSPLLIRFYNKLTDNAIVYHKKIKDDGTTKETDKKLTYSQINSMLFHYIGMKGPRACFVECENLNENLMKNLEFYINKK